MPYPASAGAVGAIPGMAGIPRDGCRYKITQKWGFYRIKTTVAVFAAPFLL
jgi:hypothetical protein